MSQQITEILTQVVLAALTALTGILVIVIYALKDRAIKWLQTHTTTAQQGIIAQIAREAFAFAESQDAYIKGKDKLSAAIDYAAKELQRRGINADRQKLLATIEAAWMQYNKPRNIVAPAITVNSSDGDVNDAVEKIARALESELSKSL
ncbi:phage holin [Paenibacillus sp. GbtcB18]|uniref:phage holin n=1 Tax=Paenibacillus sp. GbtcB18 TaxID=2824763 RepID=UPI001C2F3ECA|nr:phage holin [Paenibacillus sp. GbtcB18]